MAERYLTHGKVVWDTKKGPANPLCKCEQEEVSRHIAKALNESETVLALMDELEERNTYGAKYHIGSIQEVIDAIRAALATPTGESDNG